MCVIAYKAKDVRFPSKDNVREMWESNPDGAGVMWRTESGTVRFIKGFMKLKHLEKWIEENRAWLEEVECALHFRITTHGGTSPGNCHPFAIADADPHVLSGEVPRILMHNGILPLKPRGEDISDSAELALRLSQYDNPCLPMETLNETLSGNRIIVMDENGTHFFGDPFKKSDKKENEGLLYSNLNFEHSSYFSCGRGGFFSGVWDRFSGNGDKAKCGSEYHSLKTCVDIDEMDDDEFDEYLEMQEQYAKWISHEYGWDMASARDIVAEAESYGMDPADYVEECLFSDPESMELATA